MSMALLILPKRDNLSIAPVKAEIKLKWSAQFSAVEIGLGGLASLLSKIKTDSEHHVKIVEHLRMVFNVDFD